MSFLSIITLLTLTCSVYLQQFPDEDFVKIHVLENFDSKPIDSKFDEKSETWVSCSGLCEIFIKNDYRGFKKIFSRFPGAKQFVLIYEGQGFYEITAEMLENLNGTSTATFTKCSISNEILHFLSEVKLLRLRNCLLRSGDNPRKLPSVEKLELDDVVIPDGRVFEIFDSATQLVVKNWHSSFEKDFFNSFKKLKILSMERIQNDLSNDLFKPLAALEQLIIKDSGIRTLKRGIFKNLSKLLYLNLAENELDLNWDEFEGLESLDTLILFKNKISRLDVNNIVENLVQLKFLDLENNPVESKTDWEKVVKELSRRKADLKIAEPGDAFTFISRTHWQKI